VGKDSRIDTGEEREREGGQSGEREGEVWNSLGVVGPAAWRDKGGERSWRPVNLPGYSDHFCWVLDSFETVMIGRGKGRREKHGTVKFRIILVDQRS